MYVQAMFCKIILHYDVLLCMKTQGKDMNLLLFVTIML